MFRSITSHPENPDANPHDLSEWWYQLYTLDSGETVKYENRVGVAYCEWCNTTECPHARAVTYREHDFARRFHAYW